MAKNDKNGENTNNAPARKKLTTRKVDMAKQKPGFSVKGKFIAMTDGQPFQTVDQKTGELVTKTLKTAIFEDDKGERFSVIADKGLQGNLEEAMVMPGNVIEIVKLEKAQLSRGRTMNQYDIFALGV